MAHEDQVVARLMLLLVADTLLHWQHELSHIQPFCCRGR